MEDLVKQLRDTPLSDDDLGFPSISSAHAKAFILTQKAADEIERLRDIIDCGCNAIRDAVAVSGGDLVRINAMERRMRREMNEPLLAPATKQG